MFKNANKSFIRKTMIFVWHGFFLALTMSMLDFNTVFPSLVDELIGSKIVFGILYSIMLGVPLVFNLVFSHYLQHLLYKKKFLLFGIYLRAFSFLGMAGFVYFFAENNPGLVVISFFFWIFLFSVSGGFAGLAFIDIIGKLFKKGERGKVYAGKQMASSVAAFTGGLVVARIFALNDIGFPLNYAYTLFIGFLGLIIASLAFWFINEPPSKSTGQHKEGFFDFLRKVPDILKNDQRFFRFILVENLASFSLMILPFYMVYARETFNTGNNYIGRYLLFQVSGTIISNIVWGYLADKKGAKEVVKFCIFMGGLIPLIALLITPFGPDYFAFVFLLVGFIISGRRIGFDPYLLDIAPEEKRTVYLGIRGTLSFLTVILPVVGGLFIDLLGYQFTFTAVSIIMVIAFFLSGGKKITPDKSRV